MTLRQYLADHLTAIGAFVLGLALFCGGLWLDPSQSVRPSTLVYFAALAIGAMGLFLWWRYRREKAWLSALIEHLSAGVDAAPWPMSTLRRHRERLVASAYNTFLRDHQQQLSQLLAAQQDQKDFIDSWVHEIKVPLAATGMLRESLDGTAPEGTLDEMALQLDKINDYVEQVLYYARLDSFSKDYLLREYPLKPLVESVAVDQRNSFIAHHIGFQVTGDDRTVVTDEKWLRFILGQLFSNALKYTPEGGQITATLGGDANADWLTIQDTGIGIPKDEQHRVFEKGFTGTNGRNANQKSTGLGLYLAAELAEKLGHHLTLSSDASGTAVTIHFSHLTYFGESGSTLEKPALTETSDQPTD